MINIYYRMALLLPHHYSKKEKIKQKEEGTFSRPSSRDSNDSRGSGGASRLNADGSARGGLEAEEPIGPVGEISGWGTAP